MIKSNNWKSHSVIARFKIYIPWLSQICRLFVVGLSDYILILLPQVAFITKHKSIVEQSQENKSMLMLTKHNLCNHCPFKWNACCQVFVVCFGGYNLFNNQDCTPTYNIEQVCDLCVHQFLAINNMTVTC